MSQTIDDFRKFYFPNNSKSSFSLSESIEEALSIFSLSIKKHQIQVHFEYRGQQRAFGFQNEFRQAVLSILANARDAFIGREEKNRRIFIKIVDCGEYYRTDFTDNAGGIASSEIDKIFDPYFTTKQNGSGLGLYLAKLILENMNGRITVELTPEGSIFRLFMPKPDSADIQESA